MDVNFVVGLSHFSGKIAIFQKKLMLLLHWIVRFLRVATILKIIGLNS